MNRVLIFCIVALSWTSSFGQDVKTIVDRYFQSIGGRVYIETLKTSSFSYKSFGFYPKMDTSYIETKQMLPSKQLSRNYYNNGKLKYESIRNGDSLNLFLVEPYPSKISARINQPITLDPSTEILGLRKSKNLKYSKTESLNGIEYQVLRTDYDADIKQPNKMFYFDNQTGLLVGQKVNDNVTLYKDYRKVKSFLYPFIHEQYLNTLLLNRDIYEKVEFNIDLKTDDFNAKVKDIPPLRKLDSKYSNGNLSELISNFYGNRILIDIWATWCGPCKREFTKYDDDLYGFLKDKSIQLLFISLDKSEKENEWKKDVLWFNLNGYDTMAGKILSNSIKKEINDGKPLVIPRYILINEKGEILSNDIGKPSSSDFREKVSKLLE